MNKQVDLGYTPLCFAFLAGLCSNASLTALTSSVVEFSIFPLIALALVVYNSYQIYMTTALDSNMSKAALALFVAGFLAYTSFVRMQHPELGSNFFALMAVMLLAVYVAKLLGCFSQKKDQTEDA